MALPPYDPRSALNIVYSHYALPSGLRISYCTSPATNPGNAAAKTALLMVRLRCSEQSLLSQLHGVSFHKEVSVSHRTH